MISWIRRAWNATNTWWQKAILAGFILLVVWLGYSVATSVVLPIVKIIFSRAMVFMLYEAMPLILLLWLLTFGMGKVGEALRKGFSGLLVAIITGIFALVGVKIPKEDEKKKKKK